MPRWRQILVQQFLWMALLLGQPALHANAQTNTPQSSPEAEIAEAMTMIEEAKVKLDQALTKMAAIGSRCIDGEAYNLFGFCYFHSADLEENGRLDEPFSNHSPGQLDFAGARTFCEERGARLCTLAELQTVFNVMSTARPDVKNDRCNWAWSGEPSGSGPGTAVIRSIRVKPRGPGCTLQIGFTEETKPDSLKYDTHCCQTYP